MTSQQMHFYKYVQLHNINLHQQLSVTPVTTIRASYNKNTISIQIIVQDTPLVVTGVTETCSKFRNVHLLVYRISMKHPLIQGHGTHTSLPFMFRGEYWSYQAALPKHQPSYEAV